MQTRNCKQGPHAGSRSAYNSSASVAAEVRSFMAQMTITPVATHGFLVDGRWIEDGNLVEVRAPYDGAVIGRVFQGTRQHAEAAIAAAVKAFGTTLCFFKQKTAYDFGLGIPAEPLFRS